MHGDKTAYIGRKLIYKAEKKVDSTYSGIDFVLEAIRSYLNVFG